MKNPVIIWFRQDLRIKDNPALMAAASSGSPVVPVYIYSASDEGHWKLGQSSRWWLNHSLLQLKSALKDLGLPLVIFKDPAVSVFENLIRKYKVQAVYCNRRYEPAAIVTDQKLERVFKKLDCAFFSFDGSLLLEPCAVMKDGVKPYQVFTPFWKTYLKVLGNDNPIKAPTNLTSFSTSMRGLDIKELELVDEPEMNKRFLDFWEPGEEGAQKKLKNFIKKAVRNYQRNRDFPALEGTSQISPHLHFGEISPRQIAFALRELNDQGSAFFLREVGWREFAYRLLFFFPHTPEHPLRAEFEHFPWKKNPQDLKKWKSGLTGFPLIDAGMRQLLKMGWIHNRVRMVVGSFLVKDLLIPWQEGAKWFWEKLVDADLANNTLGWQWVGGCGADAAPYFRVFNPILQSEKFDPDGEYIRHYVPELAKMPKKWIHQPWMAPEEVLEESEVRLGKNYPMPMVDHAERQRKAVKIYHDWANKNK